MRRAAAGLVVLLALLALVRFGGTQKVADAPVMPDLKMQIQGYLDALLSGDALGAASYFEECNAAPLQLSVDQLAKSAAGARVVVQNVHIAGDRGGMTDWKFTGASQAFVNLWNEGSKSAGKDTWKLTDGQWRFAGSCNK